MAAVGILRLVVQLAAVPLLARLLSSEDYGLSAIAMPLVFFVMMIADAGLSNSLIRLPRIDTRAWHTCFWLMTGLGVILSLAVALLSPAIGAFYHDARLTPVVASLGAIIVAQTLVTVPGAALQHQKRFGLIAITEITATFASIGTAIAVALAGFGVWALVWQQIVFYGVRVILTWLFTPYRPALVFDLSEAREHAVFGSHLLGANLISYGSRSLDNLMIGKIFGPGPVGIYAMAFQFARLPFMIVSGPCQYTMYPVVAGLRDDVTAFASLFLLITRLLAVLTFPTIALVAACSQPIFHLLLSPKWGDAAAIFSLIAPAAALQPVTAVTGTFLMALGRTDLQMKLAFQCSVLWIPAVLLTVWHGIAAVAVSYSLCMLLFSLWSLSISLPLIGCTASAYARALLWPAVIAIGSVVSL